MLTLSTKLTPPMPNLHMDQLYVLVQTSLPFELGCAARNVAIDEGSLCMMNIPVVVQCEGAGETFTTICAREVSPI